MKKACQDGRRLIVWKDGAWSTSFGVVVTEVPKTSAMIQEERAEAGELVAIIDWWTGTPTHAQGASLQPMTATELRAFAALLVEAADEIEARS